MWSKIKIPISIFVIYKYANIGGYSLSILYPGSHHFCQSGCKAKVPLHFLSSCKGR